MKYYLKQLLVLAAIVTAIVSCQKDDDLVTATSLPLEKAVPLTPQQVSEARARFAKALAKASNDQEFVNFLNSEALKELTGDRDVLYSIIKDRELPETGRKVSEVLAATELSDVQSRNTYDIDPTVFFTGAIVDIDPGLVVYLYVPESMEGMDDIEIEGVAFVSESFDEQTATEVPVYNPQGTLNYMDAQIAYPSQAYYVVKESEVLLPIIDATGLTKYGNFIDTEGLVPEFAEDGVSYFHIRDVYRDQMAFGLTEFFGEIDNDGDGFFSDVNPGHPLYDPNDTDPCVPNHFPGCDGNNNNNEDEEDPCLNPNRDDRNNREELVKIKFANDAAWFYAMGFPAWLDGRPELLVTNIVISVNDENPMVSDLTSPISDRARYFRRKGNNLWYVIRDRLPKPLKFYEWNLEDIGDPMLYHWQEVDKTDLSGELTLNTPKIKIKLPLVGETTWQPFEVKIKYNPANEDLGSDLVYYCDDANGEGTTYNTGKLLFNIKEEEF